LENGVPYAAAPAPTWAPNNVQRHLGMPHVRR
jgi:hypothetical protein